MAELRDLARFIEERDRFFLVTHVNPDGDGLGSLLALSLGLRQRGKEVWPFVPDEIPPVYRWLPGLETVRRSLPPEDDYAALVLDCGDLSRVEQAAPFLERASGVAVLDHHEVSGSLGALRVVEPVFATGALVFSLLRLLGVPLSPEIAQNLYVAIFSDTGGFRFRQTTAEAFSMARDLVEAGADPALIAERLTERQPLSRFCLLRLVLDRMELLAGGRVAVSWLRHEDYARCGASKADAEDFATFLRSIEGVEVTALVKEFRAGEGSVSLRSRGRVNVAQVASGFGGGGHRCAAGFRFRGDPLETLEEISRQLEAIFS